MQNWESCTEEGSAYKVVEDKAVLAGTGAVGSSREVEVPVICPRKPAGRVRSEQADRAEEGQIEEATWFGVGDEASDRRSEAYAVGKVEDRRSCTDEGSVGTGSKVVSRRFRTVG